MLSDTPIYDSVVEDLGDPIPDYSRFVDYEPRYLSGWPTGHRYQIPNGEPQLFGVDWWIGDIYEETTLSMGDCLNYFWGYS